MILPFICPFQSTKTTIRCDDECMLYDHLDDVCSIKNIPKHINDLDASIHGVNVNLDKIQLMLWDIKNS